jgi:hypothetical protein
MAAGTKTNSKKIVWPWIVNANGKGKFHNTKAETVAAVKTIRH